MITDPNEYFAKGCGRCARFATADCSTRRWLHGITELRRICLEAGLVETAKWGHPTYTHAGRNICIIGAFREDFRLNFMNASLLSNAEGLLEKPGPNSSEASQLRFTDNAAVKPLESFILQTIEEAKRHAEAGTKPAKAATAMEWPEELISALDDDPEMAEAFHALTPGRQRSWLLHLSGAKASATKSARIIKARAKIIAGKGMGEY